MTIPENGASGVLATIGGNFGGWVLMLQDSKPEFIYALSNQPEHKFRIVSDQPLAAGNHAVRFAFKYDGGAATEKNGVGTGFLAAPDVLITSGHVFDLLTGKEAEPLRFELRPNHLKGKG